MIILEINNPQPNRELTKGSELDVRLVNSSSNLVLDIPIEISDIKINNSFNMYAMSGVLAPIPIKVKTKEYTELPTKLNPLLFYTFTVIVIEDVPLLEDFAKHTIIMRLFDEY